jgi:hypothetical protein
MSRFQTITELIHCVDTLVDLLRSLQKMFHRPSDNFTPKFPVSSSRPDFHVPNQQIRSYVPFILKQLETIQGHIMEQIGKTNSSVLLSRYEMMLPVLESKLENECHARFFIQEWFQDIQFWHQQCLSSLKRNGLEIASLLTKLPEESIRSHSYHLSVEQLEIWLDELSVCPPLEELFLSDLFQTYRQYHETVRMMGNQLHEQYYALQSLRRIATAKGK